LLDRCAGQFLGRWAERIHLNDIVFEQLPDFFALFLDRFVVSLFDHSAYFRSSLFRGQVLGQMVAHSSIVNNFKKNSKFGCSHRIFSSCFKGRNSDPNPSDMSWCCEKNLSMPSPLLLRSSVLRRMASLDRSNSTGGAFEQYRGPQRMHSYSP
jgi:hypothetical protein